MNVDEARKFLHSDARKEYSECRRAAVAYDAEIDRLRGLLREARRGVEYLIGGRSLLNEIDAALASTASQPAAIPCPHPDVAVVGAAGDRYCACCGVPMPNSTADNQAATSPASSSSKPTGDSK